GWVAPPPRKTRFWLLVQLCQAGFVPAGFQRKVSEFKSLPPSQSLPDARTPYLTPIKSKRENGSLRNSDSLAPKPLASSLYVPVSEARCPHKWSILVTSLFASHGS